MTLSKVGTFFDWTVNMLGLAGGIPAIVEKINKVWGHMPGPIQEQIKQRMPGFLGLSFEDERILNATLSKLSIAEQDLIMNFLHGKCQDFQRNRFINIVAGMEVVAGTPTIIERKWDATAKKWNDKTITGKASEDLRLNFLKKFAAYIKKNGIDKAYEYCISGRMVLENPFHQQALVKWRESIAWLENAIDTATAAINAAADSLPQHHGHLRGIFGHTIGGLLERVF